MREEMMVEILLQGVEEVRVPLEEMEELRQLEERVEREHLIQLLALP
jgi:hypothetical protein